MLKKINRISSRSEFLEAKEKGEMVSTPLFGFLIQKKQDSLKKFGFIISKKISKRAVDRNKIKRLLSEVVRKNLDNFDEGIRGIFLAKKEILGKSLEDLGKEFEKCLKNGF